MKCNFIWNDRTNQFIIFPFELSWNQREGPLWRVLPSACPLKYEAKKEYIKYLQ